MLTSYEEYLYLVEGKLEEASQMWQMVRWLGWYNEVLNPCLKAADKHKRPEDLFRVYGEKEPEKPRSTGKLDDATIESLTAIYKDFYADKPSN